MCKCTVGNCKFHLFLGFFLYFTVPICQYLNMTCHNKGTCNTITGECECVEPYIGEQCQSMFVFVCLMVLKTLFSTIFQLYCGQGWVQGGHTRRTPPPLKLEKIRNTPKIFEILDPPLVAVNFIGGKNRRTRRKPLTCRKSLTNFIT